MQKISVLEIGGKISEALENKKKNILFVSTTLEYENAVKWIRENPKYCECRSYPAALYEKKNGILVKNEDFHVLNDETLERLNDERTILFHNAFSEQSVENFEGFLDIVRERFFINRFPGNVSNKHSVEKMALFVAFTSPVKGDWACLDEKYYDLFDEVYLLD